jgi:hypothetical protein
MLKFEEHEESLCLRGSYFYFYKPHPIRTPKFRSTPIILRITLGVSQMHAFIEIYFPSFQKDQKKKKILKMVKIKHFFGENPALNFGLYF